jgi:hypothetical protein
MRKLIVLAALAAVAWWFFRRSRPAAVRVSVGYVDGSAVSPAEGSPEHERLADVARAALDA